jgi:hypothetical protein
MDWDRIENARNRARFMLAIPWLVIAFLLFAEASPPVSTGPVFDNTAGVLGIPFSSLTLAVGVFGVLVGLAWMWRIYRAPTKVEGAHWRFHDD